MFGKSRNLPVLIAIVAAVPLAGCATQSAPQPAATVTVTRTPTSTPTTPPPGPAVTRAAPGASPTAAPTMSALPGTCDTLLPLQVLQSALHRNITGQTAFVVGTAEADIGRVGYLNCRYGMDTPDAPPAIEIGISLYATAAAAAERIPATVADFAAHGASATQLTVAGVSAQLLTGGTGSGYGPSIVLSSGQRTVAVTMSASATQDARSDLTALASLALQRSNG